MGSRYDNISGVQHKVSKRYSNIGAVLHNVKNRYNNVNGIWRQTFTSGVPIQFLSGSNSQLNHKTGAVYDAMPLTNYSTSDNFIFYSNSSAGNSERDSLNDVWFQLERNIAYPSQQVLHVACPISWYNTGSHVSSPWLNISVWAYNASGSSIAHSNIPTIPFGSYIYGGNTVTQNVDFYCSMPGSYAGTVAYYRIFFEFEYTISDNTAETVTITIPWSGITWVPEGTQLSYGS